jgi:hypothetical protein
MNSREVIGSRECDARANQSSVTMDTVNRPLSNEATARLFCVSLLVAALCFVAIFPMPYGYYVFLRWVVCVTGVALAIAFPRTGYWGVALFAVAVAILFNPIVKVPLGRDAWKWFDAGAGLLFLFFCMVLGIHRVRMSPSTPRAGNLESRLDQIAEDAAERIRKRGKPNEVDEALAALEEIGTGFDASAFGLVADRVRTLILTDPAEFGKMIRRGNPVRRWVWGAISNAAGDLAESGEFHVYRGVLNPMGPGEGLLRIFDAAADELCRLGAADSDFVARQKSAIRKNIAEVG